MPDFTEYVVGFLIDPVTDNVLLIRKNRPEWQRGKLNGVGGKVEPGEEAHQAMQREFREETGMTIDDWRRVLTMEFPAARVYFYRSFTSRSHLMTASTMTDEVVELWEIGYLLKWPGSARIVPNLRWLLPLAAYTADNYRPFYLHAEVAETLPPWHQ